MGRLVRVHPCPVCNYHVEDELHHGGSGIDVSFLRNHYALANCRRCKQLVSVLVPNTTEETRDALSHARAEIVQMEADAVVGDLHARDVLPLFRAALDNFDDSVPAAVSVCTFCGSDQFDLFDDLTGAQFDAQDAWVPCPRCEEGRLLIESGGTWE